MKNAPEKKTTLCQLCPYKKKIRRIIYFQKIINILAYKTFTKSITFNKKSLRLIQWFKIKKPEIIWYFALFISAKFYTILIKEEYPYMSGLKIGTT